MKKNIPKWARGNNLKVSVDKEVPNKRRNYVRRTGSTKFVTKIEAAVILGGIDELRWWHDRLHSENENVALAAGIYLTDRRDGKAKQMLEVDNPHLRTLAERLRQARMDGGSLGSASEKPLLQGQVLNAEDFMRPQNGDASLSEKEKEELSSSLDDESGFQLSQPVE